MPSSGLFITLYDKETLNLYLDRGVYGFLMRPEFGAISRHSRHFAALADYACGRKGTHVFFFLKRHIVYGGQLIGNEASGCFFLNGRLSPMGINAEAHLSWDESQRTRYRATDIPGVFEVPIQNEYQKRCQPYLIRFEDLLGLQGNAISSDELYFELGSFNYPLPSNSIQGMGFCTLTPGETDLLILLLQHKSTRISYDSKEDIDIEHEPINFDPVFGIHALQEAMNESHLEASILANPTLLPENLKPLSSAICRQVPISPYKPYQMDRADVCYYFDYEIEKGTLPNVIIELKNSQAGKNQIEQILRYKRWLDRIVPQESENIEFYLFAPSFTKTIGKHIPNEYRSKIRLVSFDEARQLKLVPS